MEVLKCIYIYFFQSGTIFLIIKYYWKVIVNQKRLEEIPKNLSLSTRITIIKWKEVFSTCRNAYFSGQKFLCQTKRTVKRNQRNFTPLTWFYLMFVLRENCFMASNGPSHNEANDFMEVNSNFYKSIVTLSQRSKINRYPNFIAQDFFHFSGTIKVTSVS